jgi:hypothetical protein
VQRKYSNMAPDGTSSVSSTLPSEKECLAGYTRGRRSCTRPDRRRSSATCRIATGSSPS